MTILKFCGGVGGAPFVCAVAWASAEFANNGLRPMPNAMRLKSRRFIFILRPSIESRHHGIALERIRARYQPLHWLTMLHDCLVDIGQGVLLAVRPIARHGSS